MATIKPDLLYTSEHEWAKVESGTVTIGITDFAQGALGDIVFVEIPKVGAKINKGKAFGVVESIKSVSDLYAPIDGEVIERNSALEENPQMLNQDPYNNWMIKIRTSQDMKAAGLLTADQYKNHCENQ